MSIHSAYVSLVVLWVVLSLGGGALLALLATRIHPQLSFRKLWLFYTALLGFGVAILFAIGIF
jgi:hypothetical protein